MDGDMLRTSGSPLMGSLAAAAFGAAAAILLSLPAYAGPEDSAAPATAVLLHHRSVVDRRGVEPNRREIPVETLDPAEREHCQEAEELYRKLMDTHPQPIAGLCE